MRDYSMLIEDLLNEFGIVLEHGYGTFKDRPIRLVGHLFQVGESRETFDRWANSVEFEFDVCRSAEVRQLKRWLE